MGKIIKTALLRDLEQQVMKEEISYSKMVEILNDKAVDHANDWQSVAEKLADALENLVAEQNGAPVERYRDDWEEAMLKAESAFNEYKKLKR